MNMNWKAAVLMRNSIIIIVLHYKQPSRSEVISQQATANRNTETRDTLQGSWWFL